MNEIKINFQVLLDNNLTVSEYTYLYCLCNKIDFSKLFKVGEVDCDLLEEEGYIKEGECFEHIPRNKALKLFQTESVNLDSMWNSFKVIYPEKDGRRRLHDQQDACKEKFNKLIKNKPEEFDKIINGLTNELEARRISGVKREFFPAPKAMSSWLNQKQYLTYQDVEIKKEEEKPVNYGEDI